MTYFAAYSYDGDRTLVYDRSGDPMDFCTRIETVKTIKDIDTDTLYLEIAVRQVDGSDKYVLCTATDILERPLHSLIDYGLLVSKVHEYVVTVTEILFEGAATAPCEHRYSKLGFRKVDGGCRFFGAEATIVYCAECGSRMVGAANKSHDETHLYYTCPQHKQKNCKTKDIRAEYLEHHLSANIVNLILNKNNYAKYNLLIKETFSKHSNAGLKKELNGITKAIDNILKVLEINPTEEAAERLTLLSAKKAAVQKKMTAVNNTPQITPGNLKEVRKSFYHLLKESSDPVIYDILDKLIEKIIVSNDGVEIELNI